MYGSLYKTIIFFIIYTAAAGIIATAQPVSYSRDEVRVTFHQLNFIDAENCLKILKSAGYDVGVPQFPVKEIKLPIVFSIPDSQNISIVGKTSLNNVGDGAPQQRIGLIYHDSKLDEYIKLRTFINDKIDVPADQVQIEAMVVELNKTGTQKLGLEYEWQRDRDDVSETRFERHALFDENGLGLSIMQFTDGTKPEIFRAQLKALIEDRVAEVLSSPSVLTLDNRHARIEIMKEVPIIEQSEYGKTNRFDINIRFEEVGIMLNIRPRVDSTGEWVTLQVQTEVSEVLDYIIYDGEEVAPEIERRKVETISRIRNNHPFIIGGLMRDDTERVTKKIPLLGDLPLVGRLFQSRETIKEKREVIIVLTPRVIRAQASDRPVMPKDSERFDFFDTHLFRESYTLKSEDVYDLDFIINRPDTNRILEQARHQIERNPELAEKPPFNTVADQSIPGEEAVVNRMLYDIVRNLEIYKQIESDRLIFFKEDKETPAGFSVSLLISEIKKIAGEKTVKEYLEMEYPKDVLYVVFDMPESGEITAANYPVGTVKVEEMQSSTAAEQRLYELGRLDGMTRPRIAFMISSLRELERIKASIVVREILQVNDPEVIQRLANFKVGRRIAVPEIDPEDQRTFLIDRKAVKPFFMSHFYYAELQEHLRTYLGAIQEKLEELKEPDK